MTQTTSTPAQTDLYATALDGTDAEKLTAARTALESCETAFEELQGDGDEDLVRHELSNDDAVLRAVADISDLTDEEAADFGRYLAEKLVENAVEAEAAKQLRSYRAARHLTVVPDDQRLAYEPNDPKHPDFLDRIGA